MKVVSGILTFLILETGFTPATKFALNSDLVSEGISKSIGFTGRPGKILQEMVEVCARVRTTGECHR